jgi:hypothetical protein
MSVLVPARLAGFCESVALARVAVAESGAARSRDRLPFIDDTYNRAMAMPTSQNAEKPMNNVNAFLKNPQKCAKITHDA